jgi:hypothetical protein
LAYDLDVFINCPFDDKYQDLFPALVFAVAHCGFRPRCGLEDSDSAETRVERLYSIMQQCRHGIHDISRTDLSAGGFPRFNMPLELGVFLGARRFGSARQRRKRCLILDESKYRYQQFCSDLAGNDITAHSNKPETAVKVVRNWLGDFRKKARMPGGDAIYKRYLAFRTDLPVISGALSLDHKTLTYNDLTTVVRVWLEKNPW